MPASMPERLPLPRALDGWLREYALPALAASAEYRTAVPSLEQLVLLFNRVLAACDDHLDYGHVARDAQQLAADLQREPPPDRDQVGSRLISFVELYLKAVLWQVNPSLAEQLRANKGQYTLAPVLRALALLDQRELELPLELAPTVADPVRRCLLLAYRSRNEAIHNPKELAPYVRTQLLQAALTALIAPLVKHGSTLRAALAGVFFWPFQEEGLHPILRITDSERRGHLQHFVARQQWLTTLRELIVAKLGSAQGSYVLLTGREGVGKSALCAKLLADFPAPPPLGPRCDSVRYLAPWLPTALLLLGKQVRQPQEAVDLLVAQAQTLLGERLSGGPLRRPVEDPRSEPPLPPRRAPAAGGFADSRPGFLPKEHDGSIELGHLKRVLYQALERLVEERGPTLLVIDAIDEISPDGSLLGFLPESLPGGITILLTARRGMSVISRVQQTLQVQTLRLDGFDRAEIPALTGFADTTEQQRLFNDKVHKQTEGDPLLINAAMRGIRDQGGQLSGLLTSSMDAVIMRRIDDWQPPSARGSSPRYDLLLLLSLFEPVCPLPLAAAQGYLLTRTLDLTLHEIVTLLEPVRDQIAGLEDREVRLNLRLFAEYLRERHCSPRDRRRLLEQVVNWLATDEELSSALQARFFEYWSQASHLADESARQIIHQLPAKLAGRGAISTVRQIGMALRSYAEMTEALVQQCLQTAAEHGDPIAMCYLGDDMLDDILGTQLPATERLREGEALLRKAAHAGDLRAMSFLSYRLLKGARLNKDVPEGERWLRAAAAAGDPWSMRHLGWQLLEGEVLKPDRVEGEHWLRQAVAAGDSQAPGILGKLLLDGDKLKQDLVEGERWLRQAAQAGELWAMGTLGKLLLDGDTLKQDLAEGERWLRKAAEAGDPWAMGELGKRFLRGSKLPQDVGEGERWLRNAAQAGERWAMGELGRQLFEGDKLQADFAEGERWLRKGAEAGESWSMGMLGRRLLEGDKLPQDLSEGERWLRQAAQANDAWAMWMLGERLLFGDKLKQDLVEGERWLRKAAEAGDTTAMSLLSRRLLIGQPLKQDLVEGEHWLRLAAAAGAVESMRILGILLVGWDEEMMGEEELWAGELGLAEEYALTKQILQASNQKKNFEEGERWLRKAAAAGDAPAMLALSALSFHGRLTEKWIITEQWKDAAAAITSGNDLVASPLGLLYYRQGHYKEAAELFLKGHKAGDLWAGIFLAYMIRRGETPSSVDTPLPLLLQSPLAQKEPLAQMNWALSVAAGVQTAKDWEAADALVAALSSSKMVFEWWHDLASTGDAEGHLVLGWLVRHGHIADPEQQPLAARFEHARRSGWAVPEWMLQPVPPK